MSEAPEFRAEAFEDLLDSAARLNQIASLVSIFRREGLNIDEFKVLTKLIGEALEKSVGTELHIAKVIKSTPQLLQRLGREHVEPPPRLKESLKEIWRPPRIIELALQWFRRQFREWLGLPPPLTPPELIDELERIMDGLLEQLRQHTELITSFLNAVRPEVVPWLIELIKKNPGHARGALGEALCIWWIHNVVGRTKELWRNARGPIKANGVEIDVVSHYGEMLGLAEVKVAGPRSKEYDKAIKQLLKASEKFVEKPDVLREYLKHIPKRWTVSAVAIITPRNLRDYKKELLDALRQEFRDIDTAVYDANDIIDALREWPSKAKENYIELFKNIEKALEKSSS